MSHSGTTTNFGLPQFASTDKPAWLTDVNGAYTAIDTAMKNNQDAAADAQADAAQALSDASAAQSDATTAEAKASGAIASISENFDATRTYNKGDYVMYNNLLYICSADVTTPGPWSGISNWDRITIDDIISNLGANQVSYGNFTVARALFDLIDNTFAVSRGATMPGSFPIPASSRRGYFAELSFAIQIPAGSYTSNDVLWQLSKNPVINTRAIVQLSSNNIILNINNDGTVKFNSNQNVSQTSWLIGTAAFTIIP